VVTARLLIRLLGGSVLAASTVAGAPFTGPSASAAPCPDVEVTFARATTEPPGIGSVGQTFVDLLRSQVRGKSAGAVNASAHVQGMAANCPATRLVLGGYSQGAIVINLITAIPVSVGGFAPAPMPPEVADHVAAVAVFGNPAGRYVGAPLTAISPVYGTKAIDLCAAGDPICTPGAGGSVPSREDMFSPTHLSYVDSGLVVQAATFAAGRV
jgi:cutinase